MPKRLAEIVIETALADRDVVFQAVKLADDKKIPLIAALVHHTGLDEISLVAAIKRHVRIPIEDPGQVKSDPDAVRELSRDVCRRLRVMPLSLGGHASARVLHLAMADPTDAVAIAEVEHITGCLVDAALLPLSAVEELVETGYRSFVTEVMPRGHATSAQGPKITVGPAVTKELEPETETTKPTTVPFHRVSDEASLELRHKALLNLLLKKTIITRDEYQEQVRLLMKQQADDA